MPAAKSPPPQEHPHRYTLGNGCFWGRQKDFIDAEKAMGRSQQDLSAIVGYAGGRQKGEPTL